MLLKIFEHQIHVLKKQGLYRTRAPYEAGDINFSSNDYLSLSNDSAVKQAFSNGFLKYPSSSSSSALVTGHHIIHEEFRQLVNSVFDVEDSLLFSSGFAANLAVCSLLASVNATILVDKAIHASFYNGFQLHPTKIKRYRHVNVNHLISLLTEQSNQVVITEGIFSMSGQVSPLDIISANINNRAALIVDEAHAFGVLGDQGLGACAAFGLNSFSDVALRVIPLGKACASQGAIVAGNALWIDALLQVAKNYIYSTSMSPALVYGLCQVLPIVMNATEKRKKLNQLITYFRAKIQTSALNWQESQTPIQQLRMGCPFRAMKLAGHLAKQGIHCSAMRQPTVSKKDTGLRIILNAHHSFWDIDRLFDGLRMDM